MKNTIKLLAPDTGEEYTFTKSRIMLGRDPSCDIVVPDSRIMVARRHAEILIHGNTIYIRDNSSANGTRLNGIPLQPGNLYAVRAGNEITLAQSFKLTILGTDLSVSV